MFLTFKVPIVGVLKMEKAKIFKSLCNQLLLELFPDQTFQSLSYNLLANETAVNLK